MLYNQLGHTDMKVSCYSMGGSAFGNVFGETVETESVAVVKKCIESGVNLFDTAPWYGQGRSETFFGKVLPKFDRSLFYLNTKVGRYDLDPKKMFDFSAERVTKSVDDSLKLLNMDYVDIIQVHDLEFAPSLNQIINETLPALQKIKEKGKARYIGITGYPIDTLKKAVELSPVKIDAVLSYCHGTMHDNTLQDHVNFFKDRGIGVINASGVSMGLLTEQGPRDWHPGGHEVKNACKNAATYCKENDVNISKLAVHFCLTQPNVATTLFSTARLSELDASLDIINNGITEKENRVMKEVIERFFDPLELRSWEGVELKQYWEAINKKS